MKNILLILIIMGNSILAFSQVGINTGIPRATLDVNGNLIIRKVETIDPQDYVLTINNKDSIVRKVAASKVLTTTQTTVANRIYGIVSKGSIQSIGYAVSSPVSWDLTDILGNITFPISGLNVSQLKMESNNTYIVFPANKTFRVTGMIGIYSKTTAQSSGNPAYIGTQFEIQNPGNSNNVVNINGYVESSTEANQDGGVINPQIVFSTNSTGTTKIRLVARFGGNCSGSTKVSSDGNCYGTGPSGVYYMSGQPSRSSLGSYLIIEEL